MTTTITVIAHLAGLLAIGFVLAIGLTLGEIVGGGIKRRIAARRYRAWLASYTRPVLNRRSGRR